MLFQKLYANKYEAGGSVLVVTREKALEHCAVWADYCTLEVLLKSDDVSKLETVVITRVNN